MGQPRRREGTHLARGPDFVDSKAQKKLKTMKVVNDVAERGVALIQDYIHVITNDEERRQYLPHVVAAHRKNFPNSLKKTVIDALKKIK